MGTKERQLVSREGLLESGDGWLLESTFLTRLSREEVGECLGLMHWLTWSRQDQLTTLGRPRDGIDLIVSGQAVVLAPDEVGKVSPIAHVGCGSLIGERSLVSGDPPAADVVASSRVRTLHMPTEAFHRFYEKSTSFRRYVDGLILLRDRWRVLVSLLSQNPFLRSLGMDDVERLLQSAELLEVERGETVMSAGERGTEVYIVVKGRAGVYTPPGETGRRQKLAVAEPGDLLGHAAVLLECPRTAEVMMLEDSELLRIDSTSFMDIVTRNPLVQRQLLQYLATLDFAPVREAESKLGRAMTFVCSSERRLGATTLAYGVAGAMKGTAATPILVDLAGPDTLAKLGLRARKRKLSGIAVSEMKVPDRWGIRVLWPESMDDLDGLLKALKHERGVAHANAPILISGEMDQPGHEVAMQDAEAVVFIRRASDTLSDLQTRRGQLRYQAIRLEEGIALPLATSRKAARVPNDADSARMFWQTSDLFPISSVSTALGRACCRLSRLIRGRSVGIALGGGGALGFAHIGLLRVLEKAGIPIDYVAGVSFGSLAGALYAGGGLPALEQMVRQRMKLSALVGLSLFSTKVFSKFVHDIVGKQDLGSTEVPFYPVGLDLATGREFVLARGTLGLAVRSSSCMPGAFPALNVGSARLVDGGMINNVPASTIWESGSDFIICSNIIPPNPEGSRPPLGTVPVVGKLLGGLARLDDTVRALYMFASQAGRDRSVMADFIFDLHLEGYNLYDFQAGDRIADAGQQQAERLLPAIMKAHEEDGSIRF